MEKLTESFADVKIDKLTISKICISCGKKFIISKSEGWKKYCGRKACWDTQTDKDCKCCGKKFKGTPSIELCFTCTQLGKRLKTCEKCGSEFAISAGELYKVLCLRCFKLRPKYRVTDKDSTKAISWLNWIMDKKGIFIHHNRNGGELEIHYEKDGKDHHFLADGYCETTNTVYEFYGDFWHGNPKIYPGNQLNEKSGKTFGELFTDTLNREEIIKKQYNLVTIWESDWDNQSMKN